MFVPFSEEQQMVFKEVLKYLKSKDSDTNYSKEIYEGITESAEVKQLFKIHKEIDPNVNKIWSYKACIIDDSIHVYLRTEKSFYCYGEPVFREDIMSVEGIQYGTIKTMDYLDITREDRKHKLWVFPIFGSHLK